MTKAAFQGYFYHEMTIDQLERKRFLCLEFLDVLARIDPGKYNVLY